MAAGAGEENVGPDCITEGVKAGFNNQVGEPLYWLVSILHVP